MSPLISRRSGVPRLASVLLGAASLIAFGAAGPALGTASAAPPSASPAASSGPNAVHVCDQHVAPGHAACHALRRTDAIPHTAMLALPPNTAPSGYGPGDLQSAYALTTAGGAGATVAIVDANDDPNAESDLAAYRSQYGLPACTTANGCFRKINQSGGTTYPAADAGWAGEISLDVDMVSAVCPQCHILLVEANSASMSDLGTAVNQAVSQGAKFVSNSYGAAESSSASSSDSSYYNHPGVAITVSSGDGAYQAGTEFPASSQYVTSVGGTALVRASNARGWSESVWMNSTTVGGGSGCSAYITKPAWQTDSGCAKRMVADVAAVADPLTGVAVYQSYGGSGWAVYGGTSAASPIVAAVYALAGNPGANDYPAKYPYTHTSHLNDVTSGSNGTCTTAYFCTAQAGYDGPTGLGTPIGTAAFTSATPSANTFTVSASPNSGTVTAGSGASLTSTITTASTGGTAVTLTLSTGSLPTGVSVSFSPSTVTAGGTSTMTVTTSSSTQIGAYSIPVTATSPSGSAVATYQVVANPATVGITNGGFENGDFTGWNTAGTTSVVSSGAHTGTYAARLGSTSATNGDSTAAQTFVVPTGSANLSLWYKMTCPDTLQYDWASVSLRDNTTGQSVKVLPKTCTTSTAWTQLTAPVTAGHQYTVRLLSHDDNSSGDPTYTLFDDIALDGSSGANTVTVASQPAQTWTIGTAASLQMTATDSQSGQTFTWSATGLPAGLAIDSASGRISGTPTTAGSGTATVTALDTTNASGSTTVAWTVNPASAGGGVANGGFETGTFANWTTTGTTSIVSSGAHSGTYAAQLGSTSPTNGDSTAAQTFTAGAGTLSFWYNVTCPDTLTYDWATATLKDNTTNTTTTVLAKTCVSSSGWTQATSALTVGHSYTLTLTSHDDNYSADPTFTTFDDVTVS